MGQTQKAKNAETNKNQEQQNQPQAVQTPPLRQAGNNQPQHQAQGEQNQSQGLTRSGQQGQQRGLSRQGQFTPTSPFSFMRRFSEEMDRLFEDFGFGGSLTSPSFQREFEQLSAWSPQTEVFQRGNELVVQADLPGMTKDDINVDIEDGQIIIRGERQNSREQTEEGFYRTERSYGSFYRSIPLPEGTDAEAAKADFRNGVLEITMLMPEQKQRGRRLEIGEGGTSSQSQSQPNEQSKSANQ